MNFILNFIFYILICLQWDSLLIQTADDTLAAEKKQSSLVVGHGFLLLLVKA